MTELSGMVCAGNTASRHVGRSFALHTGESRSASEPNKCPSASELARPSPVHQE